MKKYIAIALIVLVAVAGYFYFTANDVVDLRGAQKTAVVSALYLHGDSNGTTTETSLFTTGSNSYVAASTWDFESSRVSELDRNILVRQRGSSTDSILNWYWEVSYDNIDWFRENVSTSTPDLITSDEFYEVYKQKYYKRDYNATASSTMTTHASTTLADYNVWDDDYVDKFQIPLPDITASYSRLTFWETGATSSIWMVIPHRDLGR